MNGMQNGHAIHERRTQLKLSCRELGDRIGVDASTISRYESGEMKISYERLILLANALDMKVADFMDWSEYQPPEPDDMERLCASLRKLGVIRSDGTVFFERLAQIERLMKAAVQCV
ncbi:hypothetical protein AGMMS49992_27010 [Clostridia bacterium]|nr:hypothetical protein AGMMS49992_27010 [Clostridia bacterium]